MHRGRKWNPTLDMIVATEKPTFELGSDGIPYAVFPDNCYSWEYAELLFGDDLSQGGGIAHFGNYENAVVLQNTIGL